MNSGPTIPAGEPHDADSVVPLFVDLDGTLIACDTFNRSLLGALLKRPWQAPRLLWTWLFRGRPAVKRLAFELADIRVAELPYHREMLDLIRQARADHRPIILATASHRVAAHRIAEHLGLFDDVLASDERLNLKAHHKLVAIEQWCEQRGHTEFAYAGDARPDLAIWQEASQAIAVNPPPWVRSMLKKQRIEATLIKASASGR